MKALKMCFCVFLKRKEPAVISEIFKETLMRRSAIRRLHLGYLVVYAVVYASLSVASPSTNPPRWGMWLFVWSGCVFPVLLTMGIFGGDIASGRMMQLVTKPMSLRALFLWRCLGVYIQCVVHLSISYGFIFIAASRTNAHVAGDLGSWFLASLVIAPVWIALSATVSTCVSRDFNVAVVFIGAIAIFMILQATDAFAAIMDMPALSRAVEVIGIYCLPSVVLLCKLGMRQSTGVETVLAVVHPVVITALCATIGIVILNHREFTRERD